MLRKNRAMRGPPVEPILVGFFYQYLHKEMHYYLPKSNPIMKCWPSFKKNKEVTYFFESSMYYVTAGWAELGAPGIPRSPIFLDFM